MVCDDIWTSGRESFKQKFRILRTFLCISTYVGTADWQTCCHEAHLIILNGQYLHTATLLDSKLKLLLFFIYLC